MENAMKTSGCLRNCHNIKMVDWHIFHSDWTCHKVLSHVPLEQSSDVGDKAYGTNENRSFLTSHQAAYAIPPKSNTVHPWACDWWVYKE